MLKQFIVQYIVLYNTREQNKLEKMFFASWWKWNSDKSLLIYSLAAEQGYKQHYNFSNEEISDCLITLEPKRSYKRKQNGKLLTGEREQP